MQNYKFPNVTLDLTSGSYKPFLTLLETQQQNLLCPLTKQSPTWIEIFLFSKNHRNPPVLPNINFCRWCYFVRQFLCGCSLVRSSKILLFRTIQNASQVTFWLHLSYLLSLWKRPSMQNTLLEKFCQLDWPISSDSTSTHEKALNRHWPSSPGNCILETDSSLGTL